MGIFEISMAVLSMGLLGLSLAASLAMADRAFHVEEDPLYQELVENLPAANCAGCGEPGCGSFAKTLISGKNTPSKCVVLSDDGVETISGILGVEVEERERLIARVFCKGGKDEAKVKGTYNGILSCTAAQFASGGNKLCDFGCIGYGDCVEKCPFDALYMSDNGLPVVKEDKCTGCGICADVCPKDVIELLPESQKVFALCRNTDKAKNAKSVCSVSCTACGLCSKKEDTFFFLENNLARVNAESVPGGPVPEKLTECPRNVIVNLDPIPEEAKEEEEEENCSPQPAAV